MYVDLVTKKYTLSVVIPNTDMFLPIKNDVASIQKAINHIMTDNIQLYNSDTKDIDYRLHDYIMGDLHNCILNSSSI